MGSMMCEGNIPHIVDDRYVPCIKITRSVVKANVVYVGKICAAGRSKVETLGPGVCHSKEESLRKTALHVCLKRVIYRAAQILGFQNSRQAAVWTERIRIDVRIRLHGAWLKLVDVAQLLQVDAASSYIAQCEGSHASKVVLRREIPSIGFRRGILVFLRGD